MQLYRASSCLTQYTTTSSTTTTCAVGTSSTGAAHYAWMGCGLGAGDACIPQARGMPNESCIFDAFSSQVLLHLLSGKLWICCCLYGYIKN